MRPLLLQASCPRALDDLQPTSEHTRRCRVDAPTRVYVSRTRAPQAPWCSTTKPLVYGCILCGNCSCGCGSNPHARAGAVGLHVRRRHSMCSGHCDCAETGLGGMSLRSTADCGHVSSPYKVCSLYRPRCQSRLASGCNAAVDSRSRPRLVIRPAALPRASLLLRSLASSTAVAEP
jgi:hypothetical protein